MKVVRGARRRDVADEMRRRPQPTAWIRHDPELAIGRRGLRALLGDSAHDAPRRRPRPGGLGIGDPDRHQRQRRGVRALQLVVDPGRQVSADLRLEQVLLAVDLQAAVSIEHEQGLLAGAGAATLGAAERTFEHRLLERREAGVGAERRAHRQ